MFKKLIGKFLADPSAENAKAIRKKQILRATALLSVAVIILLAFVLLRSQSPSSQPVKKPKPFKNHVTLAADSVDLSDVWSHRLTDKMDSQAKEMEKLQLENKVLLERMNALEKINLSLGQQSSQENRDQESNPSFMKGGRKMIPASLSGVPSQHPKGEPLQDSSAPAAVKPAKPKMAFVSVVGEGVQSFHVDSYVVAGTYSKAALMSGLVVSTATASQNNPQPIALRLLDSGNLPRGWQSSVRDAVLLGSCFGDLSSERAMCRINTLSFIEANGTGVEIPVEGWIFGEDGAPGLRGKIVDRAGEVARQSLIAGILGGMSSYLKNEAVSSVFPVTPFGQTNALSGTEVIKGSVGSGASNALEKLAEFSIKRAESMQPVVVVNGGRRVDVLFKQGFSLKREVGTKMKVMEKKA